MMKIAVACDHGGYELKMKLIPHLKEKGYEIEDYGCDSSDSVDYPEYGRKVAYAVAEGRADRGIVICTTGIGISIAANKIKGIRAAVCTNGLMAKMTRLHNDANVLALGANIVGYGLAEEITDIFMETGFSGGERHVRRIKGIEEYDR
ncbi:MAG: ribose 5-phosphate isomerase B [Lachnospiraceae bacterium]|nr:ribose 5-phosphate isomerase B [Lachnospiraceae bacterium]